MLCMTHDNQFIFIDPSECFETGDAELSAESPDLSYSSNPSFSISAYLQGLLLSVGSQVQEWKRDFREYHYQYQWSTILG